MTDKKPSSEQIKALEAQIKSDQDRPVRENERRVRIEESVDSAIEKMAKAPPITNKNLVQWTKKQRNTSQD